MSNPTIDYFKTLTRSYLLPEEVAQVLHSTAQSVRVAARQRPELLGFPVVIMGNRVRIPRIPFLNMMTGGTCE